MYYVRYFFKCVIRKLVNLIFKPKYLFTLVIIGIIFSILLCNTTFAAEGEPVITPSITYDLIINSQRLETFAGFKVYYFKVFEGQKFSYQYTTATAAETRACFTLEAPKNGTLVYNNNYTFSNRDSGYTSPETQMTSPVNGYFVFEVYPQNGFATVTFWDNSSTSDAINNQTSIITSNQDKNTQDIISNNDSNTDKIIESQEELKDSITNSDVSDESMKVNTNGLGLGDEQGVNQFFSNLLNTVRNTFLGINNTVETISIPIPFTNDNIVLSSDLVSKHIQGTTIYALIQALWWFVIGKYIVMFSYRMIAWLSTGKIADKGISSFIEYLDKNNEIINSYMM